MIKWNINRIFFFFVTITFVMLTFYNVYFVFALEGIIGILFGILWTKQDNELIEKQKKQKKEKK